MTATNNGLTIGIAGLGLIGGSLAKAYQRAQVKAVYGYDRNAAILGIAKLDGAINGELNPETIKECDAILIAIYPADAIEYLQSIAPYIQDKTIVFDCCGVKRAVCEQCFAIADQHGFTFVGGHPMAGKHTSGFKNSSADLFDGASMILVPKSNDSIKLFDRMEKALKPVGFGRLTVTTPEMHDKMIAFTSQLAHIVSNAYIKSPTARKHDGFSAGSYRDLTRVAWLDPNMWMELFLLNRDMLVEELDILMESLAQYRKALEENDKDELHRLLSEGVRIKEEVDG
ncbi:MAG TPA: prephenate dehydrogenase [Candidatus Limiplasma sp.]|nr:prephenate dehydrogenase [Candidatus Limiplasma sp.]HRX08259.1 prephenate dehydrogenase [Candidatus Limiplasma sp.]